MQHSTIICAVCNSTPILPISELSVIACKYFKMSTIAYCLLLAVILRSGCANEDLHILNSKGDNDKKLNILMVSHFPMGHISLLLGTGEELSKRGHNVSLLVVLEEAKQDKYKAHVEKYGIHLWNVDFEDLTPPDTSKLAKDVSKSFILGTLTTASNFMASSLGIMVKHANKSLAAGDWDVVIGIEEMAPLLTCIESSYSVKVISIDRLLLGNQMLPSWSWPGMVAGASSDNLGFLDRAKTSLQKYGQTAFINLVFSSAINVLSKYCPSVSLSQALTDVGVCIPAIVPTVVGYEYPGALTHMTHFVGPLVSMHPEPLTGELGEWLRSKADRSVVYISMGSIFSLDKESGRAFLEGVMKTNLSLLWSLRESNQWILEGLDVDTDRVLISEWTPQFSVLASRAIHSAILHGGFNGLSEALWNGVPVLVLPQMLEQLYNAGHVHFNGLGIHLDATTLSSSKVTESLRALDTGEYRSKLARLQKMFGIAGGVKKAADLVEFYEEVGYAHLVPAYAKYQWSWVQYYNADVSALIMLILVLVGVCFVTCCKCICKKCSTKKNKDKKK